MYSPRHPPLIRVTTGSVFSEITTTLDHVTHTLRLYHIQGKELYIQGEDCMVTCLFIIDLYNISITTVTSTASSCKSTRLWLAWLSGSET